MTTSRRRPAPLSSSPPHFLLLYKNPTKSLSLFSSHSLLMQSLIPKILLTFTTISFFFSSSSSSSSPCSLVNQSKTLSSFFFSTTSRSTSPLVQRFSTTDRTSLNLSSKMGVVATPSDEVGLANRFWKKFKNETVFAMYTPFVVSLASGKLDLETFRHYIAQDVHFLRAFAQAYQLAEDCADDDDDKAAIVELRKSVLQELKMHNSYVQEWGLDTEKEIPCNSATSKYTDFLLATASGKVTGGKAPGKIATPFEKTKIAAYTLGAMTPCMRLYAFLGKELKALSTPDESSHPYKKWIDNYSSEAFEASALQTEILLDKLSVSLTGEELEVIEKLYHQAMKLEIEFFLAQPIQRNIVPMCAVLDPAEHRLFMFSDFDLTCTVVDSSAILAEIAIVTAPKSDQNEPENLLAWKSSSDLRNTWGMLSSQYTEDYEKCIERLLPPEKEKEFAYESLCKALENLSEFEKLANTRVVTSGVLKGIPLEDIKRAGQRVMLQDGCKRFFQKIVKEKLNVGAHILSYCWCGDLIRSAFSSGGLHVLEIHANEFAYEESISTGEIIRKLESPMDKLQAFKQVIKDHQSVVCSDETKNIKQLSVYVGDSVGDLLCLLEADVGIVIGSSVSLRKVASEYGVSFVPLFFGLVKKQKESMESGSSNWKGLTGTLYTVSSWAEVHAFILGSESTCQ